MDHLIEEIRKLLNFIGLGPIWNSVIVLSMIIIGFFFLRFLKRRSALSTKIDDDLKEYSKAQGEELIEAYRLLYEGEIKEAMEPARFVEIVRTADKKIRGPYTKHKLLLDDSVKKKIINIHNILEQFLHNPSPEAIIRFIAFKDNFYKMAEEASSIIKKKYIKK